MVCPLLSSKVTSNGDNRKSKIILSGSRPGRDSVPVKHPSQACWSSRDDATLCAVLSASRHKSSARVTKARRGDQLRDGYS